MVMDGVEKAVGECNIARVSFNILLQFLGGLLQKQFLSF